LAADEEVELGFRSITVPGIKVTRPSFPFYGLAAFGFRPRLDGVTARLSWRLTASRKSGALRDRPIHSFRRKALNTGSSGSVSGRYEIADTASHGWPLTKASSRPEQ
jgi:hypothetical protein